MSVGFGEGSLGLLSNPATPTGPEPQVNQSPSYKFTPPPMPLTQGSPWCSLISDSTAPGWTTVSLDLGPVEPLTHHFTHSLSSRLPVGAAQKALLSIP